MTLLTACVIWRASIVVDGTRYFFLDNDQMVSMRYARNLAEGLGPVWNGGERVEGYTSVGWMLVMAAVHWLGASDACASLWVKLVNWGLAIGVLLLSERLLRQLTPGVTVAAAGVLRVALALCADVVFWSANGFETTLLTVNTLAALLLIVRDGDIYLLWRYSYYGDWLPNTYYLKTCGNAARTHAS